MTKRTSPKIKPATSPIPYDINILLTVIDIIAPHLKSILDECYYN